MAAVALALAAAACGGESPRAAQQDEAAFAPAPTDEPAPAYALPAPGAALPRTAAGFARELAEVRPRLRDAAAAWDGSGRPPEALELLALREQRLTLRLSRRPRLVGRVLHGLPRRERFAVRDDVRALQALAELSAGWPVKRRHRTQDPEPARALMRHYRAAHRRFEVPVSLLAAVNHVESAFGRLRNDSVAGAQGPMQFMPATWAAYGMGGDVQDPRDAIMGAANYLRASGSPADDARALYAYNPSALYVRAVRRYERRMRTPAQVRAFYARSVFVRAPGGGHRRITGPRRP